MDTISSSSNFLCELEDTLAKINLLADHPNIALGSIEHKLELLRSTGALLVPLPVRHGGLGFGSEIEGAFGGFELLRKVGRVDLALGRLLEAHINVIKLVTVFGDESQLSNLARLAKKGSLFGLWVTDDFKNPVQCREGLINGRKSICSGVGLVQAALVTAVFGDVTQMIFLSLEGKEQLSADRWALHGMETAQHGSLCLEGVTFDPASVIGKAGDYLQQPHFSAGAWRTSAVTLGGLDALIAHAHMQLIERQRDHNPHQQARMGKAAIAHETANLWLRRCAAVAEGNGYSPAEVVCYVNLTRLAVERACLDCMELVQRSLGLNAFVRSNPVEKLCRDLSTYLRQPAPDETLTEAALHVIHRGLPEPRQ